MLSRKKLTFDFDTKLLKQYYPHGRYDQIAKEAISWRNAYYTLRDYFNEYGFKWQQGSTWISEKPISNNDASYLFEKICIGHQWIGKCIRDVILDDYKEGSNLTYIAKQYQDVSSREEMYTQEQTIQSSKPKNKVDDDNMEM